jgi:hypothetical protein
MPIETVFLDAGGVLVFPNWERVSDASMSSGRERRGCARCCWTQGGFISMSTVHAWRR